LLAALLRANAALEANAAAFDENSRTICVLLRTNDTLDMELLKMKLMLDAAKAAFDADCKSNLQVDTMLLRVYARLEASAAVFEPNADASALLSILDAHAAEFDAMELRLLVRVAIAVVLDAQQVASALDVHAAISNARSQLLDPLLRTSLSKYAKLDALSAVLAASLSAAIALDANAALLIAFCRLDVSEPTEAAEEEANASRRDTWLLRPYAKLDVF
jgi:hypothetical protein